jgi:hypothetical protein
MVSSNFSEAVLTVRVAPRQLHYSLGRKTHDQLRLVDGLTGFSKRIANAGFEGELKARRPKIEGHGR